MKKVDGIRAAMELFVWVESGKLPPRPGALLKSFVSVPNVVVRFGIALYLKRWNVEGRQNIFVTMITLLP